MIPDLGKYGAEVMSAYGVSFALLLLLVLASLLASRKAGKALKAAEERRQNG